MIDFKIDIKNECYLEDNEIYDGYRNIYFILNIDRLNKLASLARDYYKWSFDLNCIKTNLSDKIINKDKNTIEILPNNIILGVEYLLLIFNRLHERIYKLNHNIQIIFSLISPSILEDNMLKTFIPFTNIRKIHFYENQIIDMLREIMKISLGKEYNVMILYPLDNIQKRQTKFKELLRIAKS